MKDRTAAILESTLVLMLACCGIALAHVWKAGPLSWEAVGVILIVPMVALAIFICTSLLIPEVFAVRGLSFPLPLTLPAIFIGFIFTTQLLVTRVGVGIAKLPDRLQPIQVWSEPPVLAYCFVACALCLGALSLLSRDPEQR